MIAAQWTGAAVTLGVLALVALAGYFVVLGIFVATTRPRRPAAGPAVMDIPSDEPPAVAGFLANTWKVPRAAVPATLIDLAARRIVTIEEVSPEDFNVRLRNREGGNLTAYEERVYDHVRGLADSHGVVPCGALTTGPQEQSSAWWKSFRSEVVADAQGRGLSRNRWRGWEMAVLALVAAVPAGLGFAALSLAYDNTAHPSSSNDSSAGWWAIVAWVVLVLIPLSLRAQRETARGSTVASRWLGLQAYLRQDDSFADAPVASVAIWQRYLSYGAALGVARAAVAALPMGSESIHEAWSKQSGRWRLVHITYRNWPPGWGRAPRQVVWSGALTFLAAGATSIGASIFLIRLAAAGTQTDKTMDEFRTISLWALAGILVIALFWFVASVVWLAYAVPDLKARTTIRGRLLRIREEHTEESTETWIAVDDGTAPQDVRAFLLMHNAPPELVQGCLVDVTVSPRLGHVFALSRVPEPGSVLPSRRAVPAVDPLSRRLLDAIDNRTDEASPHRHAATSTLDLASIAAATGVRLSVAGHQAIGGRERWELVDGVHGHVLLRRDAETSWSNNVGCLLGMRGLARLARRRRTSVAGVGQWAKWSAKRSTLMAYGRGYYVSAIIQLNDAPQETRRQVAIALARQVV